MKPSTATLADWRAQVDRELAGAAFEKLVATTAEGLAVQPLYTAAAADPGIPGAPPFVRGAKAQAHAFRICMQVDPAERRRPGALADDLDGGADALWIDLGDAEAERAARALGIATVVEMTSAAVSRGGRSPDAADRGRDGQGDAAADPGVPQWLGFDPLHEVARGTSGPASADPALLRSMAAMIDDLGHGARRPVRVSSLAYHEAGADAADELAIALSTAVAYLRALTEAGIATARAPRLLWFQIAVGRDTFGELCKLRALRLLGHKVFAAAGVPDAPIDAIHAVCSARTESQRDPWVNLLRVTTQVFAAALGGAQLITPRSFDAALGAVSAQGRRAARNTALVLREESDLGRVLDAAGGSYYIESRTDALAREAWSRFTALEREGGVARLLASGALRARLGDAWARRAQAIARRKEPVLGVSEFANLDERLPGAVPPPSAEPPAPALVAHRDAEAFEALRSRVETAPAAAREVALVALGPPAEHRARVGYATAVFATAGLRSREHRAELPGGIACLCGSDERYAAEAAARAAELRAAGFRHIALAGRPGALETELRAAGVDAFVFVGCDVVAVLAGLVDLPSPSEPSSAPGGAA
jgi:methylmalonyl-CoA mutase